MGLLLILVFGTVFWFMIEKVFKETLFKRKIYLKRQLLNKIKALPPAKSHFLALIRKGEIERLEHEIRLLDIHNPIRKVNL